jgi:two-component system, NtrC family, response regulator HydG
MTSDSLAFDEAPEPKEGKGTTEPGRPSVAGSSRWYVLAMTAADKDADEHSTIAQRLGDVASEASVAFGLTVTTGTSKGASVLVDGGELSRVLVGVSRSCQLQIDDPLASRRHVAFELAGARLSVTDLGSTNGTTVNGVSIERAFIGHGDLVSIGETTLRVDRSGTPAKVPASTAMCFGKVVGASLQMRRLYPLFERLAAVSVPMVLEGETGTGKEVLAESIHEASPRASGPFVVFDCTTVAPNFMESALFGHEPGAFTGAVSAVRGAFERAHTGTLLLDEIGELDIALQAKLLRAVERAEIQRIGSERVMKVDVRVMASTRRDLDQEIQEGRFRDDLFFRLAVARVELPPLRVREGDIGVLARQFWKKLGGDLGAIPYDAFARFERYTWPGNVRELFNAVLRLVALGEWSDTASPAHGPEQERGDGGGGGGGDAIEEILRLGLPLPRARERAVQELERRYVEKVLVDHGGSVARAAAASGIALRYFQLIRARSK